MFVWRLRATPSARGGTSETMTDPAAVNAPSPTVTGATKVVSTELLTPAPIVVRCLRTPS